MDAMEKDARRMRWLIKQIDARQLAIAQVPHSDSNPLTPWENATCSQDVLERIDRAMGTADVLASWVGSNKNSS